MRRSTTVARLVLVAALVATLLPVEPSFGYPGEPKTAFGSSGSVTFDIGGAGNGTNAVAVLADGRVLVGGYSGGDAALSLLTGSGAFDSTFGSSGTVISDLGTGGDHWIDVAVQSDGKLLAMGLGSSDTGYVLARFNTNGTADATFGTLGVNRVSFGYTDPASPQAGQMLLAPDGKILLSGSDSRSDPYPPNDGFVARFLSNGALDTSFGGGDGVAIVSPDPVEAVALQPDGKIVVGLAGRVARISSTGELDTAFGSGGFAVLADLSRTPGALLVQPTGGIVAALGSNDRRELVLRRLLPTGAADGAFANPTMSFDSATSWGRSAMPDSLLAQPDGRLLVTLAGSKFAVARFWPDGAPDNGFGWRGQVVRFNSWTGFGALAPDGSLVVAGTNSWFSEADSAVARFSLSGGVSLVNGVVLDAWGGLHPFSASPATRTAAPVGSPYWSGWDIARGVVYLPNGRGGYEVDGYGGFHSFRDSAEISDENPPPIISTAYWKGWDIVRGVALLPDNRGGFVLDGWGGLHRFKSASRPDQVVPAPNGAPYWNGFNIARGLAILPSGKGGYVLDGFGGLHPFGVGGTPPPPIPTGGPYWNGWDIAKGVTILPDGTGGYVVDAWGGLHPFAIGANPPPPRASNGPYWPGWPVVRGVASAPCRDCRDMISSPF